MTSLTRMQSHIAHLTTPYQNENGEEMERVAHTVNRTARLSIVNHTDLPLTAVCVKWLLANGLSPGGVSSWSNCPIRESIEFQFAEEGTPYEQILWANPTFDFVGGHCYRITVAGNSSAPSFSVEEVSQ